MGKLSGTLIAIVSFLTAPWIAVVLVFLYLYRCVVSRALRIQLKDKFGGLLSGTDTVWAVEEPASLAVINVLLILERDNRYSNADFLENFRSIAKTRIVDSPCEKLRYARRKKFGYYFWEKCEYIDLKKRVRWLEFERTNCDGSCDDIYNGHLRRILWNVCNQPLPDDHSASWEILVGKCCPRSSHHYLRQTEEHNARNGIIRIPVLLRVHHSLGDGMSLLKFFREALIDKEPIQEIFLNLGDVNFSINKNQKNLEALGVVISSMNYPDTRLVRDEKLMFARQENFSSASMPFIHFVVFLHFAKLCENYISRGLKFVQSITMNEVKRQVKICMRKQWHEIKSFAVDVVYENIEQFLRMAIIVTTAPICLIQQALRSMDNSALHGPMLSGDKMVSYWLEDDFKNSYEQKLFTKIQSIKNITGTRFGDVFLAALSVSLHKYFLRINEAVPETVSVILPSSVEGWTDNLSLQNNISVGLLPLCIAKINEVRTLDPNEDSQILGRLEDIKNANDKLKESSDYTVNFMVMKYLSALLPERFLRPILESHSTMVFSNLVGPREVQILGYRVKNIAFWIPSRSHTGVCCSLLTYRGYLQLSLMADKALVRDEKLLTGILENTVHEIDILYDRLTLSCFSKRLRGKVRSPTKKEIGVL